MVVQRFRSLSNRPDVGTGLDKGLADSVESFFCGELQAFVVTLREGADAEIYAGEIEPLAGPQLATDDHLAGNVIPGNGHDLDLDDAVIDKESISGLYCLGKPLEADRHPST